MERGEHDTTKSNGPGYDKSMDVEDRNVDAEQQPHRDAQLMDVEESTDNSTITSDQHQRVPSNPPSDNDLDEDENAPPSSPPATQYSWQDDARKVKDDMDTDEDDEDSDSDVDSFSFQWALPNFAQLIRRIEEAPSKEMASKLNRVNSPIFTHPNGDQWRLLVFPRNNQNTGEDVSAYLEALFDDVVTENPHGGAKVVKPARKSKSVRFTISIVNSNTKKPVHRQEAHNVFSESSVDWGFRSLTGKAKLDKESGNLQPDGGLLFEVKVYPTHEYRMMYYDSKSETGMVGLRNLGATCYLNSLLQTLYHTREFRSAVYSLDTSKDASRVGVALELQRLFWNLQTSDAAVVTRQLTDAFGWTNYECFTQHDVQELNRELCDKLEERMENTPLQGTIGRLFKGQYKSFIRCVDVDYESSREEAFYDIQLDVKGMKNVYESFAKYVEVERLDGENQYEASGHGKQDADKGVGFLSFPPVLHLHLKRFEYNMMMDTTVKINDRYEFPCEMNLDQFLYQEPPPKQGDDDGEEQGGAQAVGQQQRVPENGQQQQPPGTDHPQAPGTDHPNRDSVDNKTNNENYDYVLHSVLVHSGDIHCGHYYAFVHVDGQWFKFDDETVTKVSKRIAVDNTFGGEGRPGHFKSVRWANAYMLVYVRKSHLQSIMKPLANNQVPRMLVDRFHSDYLDKMKAEEDARQRHLFYDVKIATMDDVRGFSEYKMNELNKSFTDFVDFERCAQLRVSKQAQMTSLYRLAAEHFSVDATKIQLWWCTFRENSTTRPDELIAPPHDASAAAMGGDSADKTVEDCVKTQHHMDLYLWMEVLEPSVAQQSAVNGSGSPTEALAKVPAAFPSLHKRILLLVRFFDQFAQRVIHLMHIYADPTRNVGTYYDQIRAAAIRKCPQYSAMVDAPVRCYEIVTPLRVEELRPNMSFVDANVNENGDIVCFQFDIPNQRGMDSNVSKPTGESRAVSTNPATVGRDDADEQDMDGERPAKIPRLSPVENVTETTKATITETTSTPMETIDSDVQETANPTTVETANPTTMETANPNPATTKTRFLDTRDFLRHAIRGVTVRFVPLMTPQDPGFTLDLYTDMKYGDILTAVASQIPSPVLPVPPRAIQFTSPVNDSKTPCTEPLLQKRMREYDVEDTTLNSLFTSSLYNYHILTGAPTASSKRSPKPASNTEGGDHKDEFLLFYDVLPCPDSDLGTHRVMRFDVLMNRDDMIPRNDLGMKFYTEEAPTLKPSTPKVWSEKHCVESVHLAIHFDDSVEELVELTKEELSRRESARSLVSEPFQISFKFLSYGRLVREVLLNEPVMDLPDSPHGPSSNSDGKRIVGEIVPQVERRNGQEGGNGHDAEPQRAVAHAPTGFKELYVVHFHCKPDGSFPVPFGVPFKMAVFPEETLASLMYRVKLRLNVKSGEFVQWRPALFRSTGGVCEMLDIPLPAKKKRQNDASEDATGKDAKKSEPVANVNDETAIEWGLYSRKVYDMKDLFPEGEPSLEEPLGIPSVLFGLKHVDHAEKIPSAGLNGKAYQNPSLSIRSS